MENEDAFAVEAQDETLELRRRELQRASDNASDDHLRSEETPLLSKKSSNVEGRSSDEMPESRNREINQPWTGAQGSEALPWYRKPSILWLLPAFLPFCLAFGGLIVPKTYLILDLLCQDYLSDRTAKDPSFNFAPVIFGTDNPQCRDPHVQRLAARFQLYSSLLSGLFSAIVAPHLGALSDRVGRKKVIAFASLGSFLAETITIIVGTHPGEISVYWLLLGFLFDGLCGSFTTSMALSFAYAADCTAPERRNVAFGYFHGTLFAGIALGPILAGYLIKWAGTIIVVFYVAIGAHAFFILFLLLVIPESLSKERQIHAREKHRVKMQEPRYETWSSAIRNYNPFEPLWILWPKGEGSSPVLRRNLALLASVDTLMFGVAMGAMGIILIYAQYMFGWDAVMSSIFLSTVNICRVTALIIFLPLMTRLVRGPTTQSSATTHHGADILDINAIKAAVLFDLLGYVGYAGAQTGEMMILAGVIASFGGIGSPTLQSTLTKHIPPERTGQMLGATGLLHALARVVAPTLFNLIYWATVGPFPRTVFICLASVFVIAFIMTWFIKPNVHYDDKDMPATGASSDDI